MTSSQYRFSRNLTLCALTLAGCSELHDGFTDAEWYEIHELSDSPEPVLDSTNVKAADPAAAALGQRLFFEASYSGPLAVGNDGQNGATGDVGETGKLSCASCHMGEWSVDMRSSPSATSLGTDWLARNASTLVDVSLYEFPWYHRDGRFDSIWSAAVYEIEAPNVLDSSRLRLAHVMWDEYREDYEAVFGPLDPALDPDSPDAARFPAQGRPGTPEWDAMTLDDQRHASQIMANAGKALHAYIHTLTSGESAFDRYVAGDADAISPVAKRGLKLFLGKAACIDCHEGPVFSHDEAEFYNVGLAPEGDKVTVEGAIPDEWPLGGRAAVLELVKSFEFNSDSPYSDDRSSGRLHGEEDEGEEHAGEEEEEEDHDPLGGLRVESLRHVAETGPYMRTGQFATLREVVEFYNDGGSEDGFVGEKSDKIDELNLSEDEIDDLVAYLETLTGAPVDPALLVDTSNQE